MKLDPYHHKERYLKWKEKIRGTIPGLTLYNSQITLQYLNDMEKGLNVVSVSVKGARSYIRLNSLREKLISFSKKFKELYNLDKITDISEEQLITFFSELRNGTIKRKDGSTYTNINTPATIFKAFWHWHQKVSKKQGIEIPDITVDLDTKTEKPIWVYMTEAQVKQLCDYAKPEYKALIMFLFDTGIRAPTELMNVKVSDIYNDFKEVQISQEASKTFGRRIKLMLCSDILREYVRRKGLQSFDYLFPISPASTNKYSWDSQCH